MDYTDSQLQKVEKLASLYMPISDIAIMIDVNSHILRADIRNRYSDVSIHYYRGKAQSKHALRENEMELAKLGSPLALENCRHNLLDMEDDE